MGWVINTVYVLLLAAVSPLLGWRMLRLRKYRSGWGEKLLGRLPRFSNGQRVVWIHAVSVGEVLQLRTIVPRLREARPDCQLLITTTTSTGRQVARETFADCHVASFPLDFTWSVREALDRVRPAMVVLIELELWPNFIRACGKSEIPLVLINGRMSDRSFRGYNRVRWLMQTVLRRFSRIAVQTDDYAARLLDLGAPPRKLCVTGSVKFDGVQTDRSNSQTRAIREAFAIGLDERVLIAGSTHNPEEQIAIAAYQQLREEFADLRLILVPRHAERFEEAAALVSTHGLPLLRRSVSLFNSADGAAGTVSRPIAKPEGPARGLRDGRNRPVCLLDTLGELSACWGLADVAFVGGSLTSRGGQNMIEPAAYGAAVIVGPDTHNFRDVVEGLRSVGGIRVIGRPEEFADAVRAMLCDRTLATAQGTAARNFVLAQQGATNRTVEILLDLLPSRASARAA